MLAIAAVMLRAAFECVFDFENKIGIWRVAEAEAQPPKIVGERGTIATPIAVARDAKTIVRQNLAVTRRAIKLFRDAEYSFRVVVSNIATIVRRAIVIVVMNAT